MEIIVWFPCAIVIYGSMTNDVRWSSENIWIFIHVFSVSSVLFPFSISRETILKNVTYKNVCPKTPSSSHL